VAQVAAYKKALDLLEAGRDVREGLWTEMEADALTELALLSAKPIVYLLNASADDFLSGKCEWYKPVREWVAKRSPGAPSLIFSGDWEADLMLMEGEERAGYIADSVAETPRAADAEPLMVAESTSYVQAAAYADAAKTHSMLPAIITSGYSALNLQQYFTVGEVEVRAWTIKKDTLAPGAAGVIHSDFEKNFICGEIYAYDDIYALGSEDAVKKAGKLKTQGKAYVMQDGDICEWRHGARK
jgi:obg-like ATPase 1